MWRFDRRPERPQEPYRRWLMAWLGRLDQARAELAERRADPWRKKLEGAVRGIEAISTAALLDLLRVPATTGTARRLAKIMRGLNFIPIKSRRLMPGGFRDTVTRGWARPLREVAGANQEGVHRYREPTGAEQGVKVAGVAAGSGEIPATT
jgi:hypothetical protein